MLADLKMPGALEAVDGILSKADGGSVASSRGRRCSNTPLAGGEFQFSPAGEAQVTLITPEAECTIFTRHEHSVFVRR